MYRHYFSGVFYPPKPDKELDIFCKALKGAVSFADQKLSVQWENFFNAFKGAEKFSEYFKLNKIAQNEGWSSEKLFSEQQFVVAKKIYLAINKSEIDVYLKKLLIKAINLQLVNSSSQVMVNSRVEIIEATDKKLKVMLESFSETIINPAQLQQIKARIIECAFEYSQLPTPAQKSEFINIKLHSAVTQILDPENERTKLGTLPEHLQNFLLKLDESIIDRPLTAYSLGR